MAKKDKNERCPFQEECERKCEYKFSKRCKAKTLGEAHDLIIRQKAEIERLKKEIENLEGVQEISPEAKHFVDTKADKVLSLLNTAIKLQEKAEAEAIKEFAQRLEDDLGDVFMVNHPCVSAIIDDLVKEMTGGRNEQKTK